MAVLHEDTVKETLVRHNIAALLSIGVPINRIAKGSKVNVDRLYAFTASRGNLKEQEVEQLLQYFKKVKKYIIQMLQ